VRNACRTPPTIGRVSAGTARYHGPILLPEPPPPKRGLFHKVVYAVVTVLLFSVAAYGLYKITMPRSGRPSATSVDDGAGTANTTPPFPHSDARPSATGKPAATHPSAPQRDSLNPSGVPMPIGELPGWHQTFTEDFVGDSLNDAWFTYEGQPAGDNGGWFSPSHVAVDGGKLVIRAQKEQTARGPLYVTGGVSNHNVFSQKYGRFDVRFRMDKGVGIAYALLLWPSSDKWPPEIDIIEDNGHDRTNTSATMHYDPDDKKIQRFITKNDFSKWHTATLEWTPGHLVYRLDGKVWATIDSSHVPDEPMDLALQTQAWGCGGTWEACPNSTTPPVVNLEVDWVSLYEWTGP